MHICAASATLSNYRCNKASPLFMMSTEYFTQLTFNCEKTGRIPAVTTEIEHDTDQLRWHLIYHICQRAGLEIPSVSGQLATRPHSVRPPQTFFLPIESAAEMKPIQHMTIVMGLSQRWASNITNSFIRLFTSYSTIFARYRPRRTD